MALGRSVRVASFALLLWLTGFCVATAEQITDFSVAVELDANGSFVVSEAITYDFGTAEKRGIYRNIKNQHAQPASAWYKDRSINLELLSVSRNGRSEQFQEEAYDGLSVRVGDPAVFLTGEHLYEIIYRVDGAIATYADLNEFYWNVTGEDWSIPIESSSVVLTAPPGVLTTEAACYMGPTGATRACSGIEMLDETIVRFTADRLAPGEQLTVAQALTLPTAPQVIERLDLISLAVSGLIVWSLVLFGYIYHWRTKYKMPETVIAQYEPLPDAPPMFTGVLQDGRLDARDISAGLVYLAQQGFIRIKETKETVLHFFTDTDYKITLLRPISDTETEFQKTILELLFSDIRFESGEFSRQQSFVGDTISLDELKANQAKLRGNVERISELKRAIKKDLIDHGYFETRFPIGSLNQTVSSQVLLMFAGFIGMGIVMWLSTPLFVFVLISGICLLSFTSERRTRKGYSARTYLKGFKKFLSVTEKERYAFHNPPSKSPEQFMQYLPYAIAFGVEEEWAELFADIQIIQPSWYESSESISSFNSSAFTSSMAAFSSSFSSSSGSSGSSGSGSSGGGSGGGGGSSW